MSVKKNFYSDNVSGAAPEILEALVTANAGDTAPYGADPITEGLPAKLLGTLRDRRRGLSGGHRHRGQRALRVDRLRALRGHLPLRRRRTSTAASAAGRSSGRAATRARSRCRAWTASCVPADLARMVDEAVARAGHRGAAAGGQHHPGHGGQHGVLAGRDPRDRRGGPRAAPVGPHGRRAPGQRGRPPRLHAGRGHLEGGRRRALVRRHQERGAHRRGGGVLQPRARPEHALPPPARRPPLLEDALPLRPARGLHRGRPLAPQRPPRQRDGPAGPRGPGQDPRVRFPSPTEINLVLVALPQPVWDGLVAEGYSFSRRGALKEGVIRIACAFDTTEEAVDALVETAHRHAGLPGGARVNGAAAAPSAPPPSRPSPASRRG